MLQTPRRLEDVMPKRTRPGSPFGERLTRLRLALGLTQTQLAEKIGSTQRNISAYETLLEYPPTAVVIQLAKELQVSADELLGLRPPPKVAQPKDDPEIRRLWKNFQKMLALPERDRRAVVRLINSLGE